MSKNIDSFNKIIGFTLNRAYSEFPCVVDIAIEDMLYLANFGCNGKNIEDEKKAEFIISCLNWLSDETSLVEFDVELGGIHNIKLTLKGLSYLKKVPKSIDTKTTIGDMLSQGIAKGFKHTTNKLVTQAIDILLENLTNG